MKITQFLLVIVVIFSLTTISEAKKNTGNMYFNLSGGLNGVVVQSEFDGYLEKSFSDIQLTKLKGKIYYIFNDKTNDTDDNIFITPVSNVNENFSGYWSYYDIIHEYSLPVEIKITNMSLKSGKGILRWGDYRRYTVGVGLRYYTISSLEGEFIGKNGESYSIYLENSSFHQ